MRKTRLAIIREAIAIRGYIPVPGPSGVTYRVTGIRGTAPNGAWVTTHPTANLTGYVRIKKSAQGWITDIARGIIARKVEIEEERRLNLTAALDR